MFNSFRKPNGTFTTSKFKTSKMFFKVLLNILFAAGVSQGVSLYTNLKIISFVLLIMYLIFL